MSFLKSKKGFTLIELLVVISIIGLLASVVLTALNTARDKSRDAAVKRGANELRKLFELNRNDTGVYTNLQNPRRYYDNDDATSTALPCENIGAGPYETQAEAICNDILSKFPTKVNNLYLGNTVSTQQSYSIMVKLSNDTYYCIGSSGRTSTGPVSGEGCYANP